MAKVTEKHDKRHVDSDTENDKYVGEYYWPVDGDSVKFVDDGFCGAAGEIII